MRQVDLEGRLLALEMLLLPLLAGEPHTRAASAQEWMDDFDWTYAEFGDGADDDALREATRRSLADIFGRILMLRAQVRDARGRGAA